MIFLKKYITILLLLMLCTPSLDAMAQNAKKEKRQRADQKTEVVQKKGKKSAKAVEAEPIVAIHSAPAISTTGEANAPTETPELIKPDTVIITPLDRIQQRGITNMANTFISKGSWIGGASASYSQHINDSYNIAIIEGIASEGYTFRVSAMGAYALRNNMAVGLRATYNRSNLTVNNAGLKFGDDDTGTEINIDNYKAVRHSYNVSGIWRQYIPLGQSKRFAIFNEISLGAGGLQSIYVMGQPIKGTYERGYIISLGVSPGLMAFATDEIAIEVNVGVMGINFSDVKQVHNQIYEGIRRSSNMNFNVNLLSIGVGVSFYL